MAHENRPPDSLQTQNLNRRIARRGLVFFFIYLAAYAGFVALCAVNFRTMETPVFGVNLAIAYGFGLIGFAFVLAMIYMWLCRPAADGKGDSR